MNKHDMEECLKRAAECIRLAEAANDPGDEDIFDEARLILASRRGGGC
jgi:hypothetical protein